MKYVKIKEVAEVVSGSTPKTNIDEYWNGEYNWITPKEITEDSKYIYNTERTLSIDGIKSCALKELKVNTVLLTSRAPIGKVALVGKTMYCNQGFKNLVCNEQVINPEYMYYWLKSHNNYLNSLGRGATFKEISKKIVEEIEIPLQDLDTQHKIVEILDKAQELIDKRKEQMELLDELIQSKFLEMFGNPVTNPKGWEVEKINTIAPIEQYKGEINDGKVWLLNLDMVESNSGRIINYNYVDKEEVGNSTCTFSTDNVLYSKLRPYLNKVAIPDREGYATSEMIPLKPNREILNREYFAYSLRSKAFVDYISEKVSGAKMPRVVMSDFKNFKLTIPPLALQEEFADFVGKVNDIKIVLNKSLEQLNNNFDSLINKAFKGELF